MPTAPLNLKSKLYEKDAYLVSEECHPDGSSIIVAVVANPKYRALFRSAPLLLAACEMAAEKLLKLHAIRLWNEHNGLTMDEAKSLSEQDPPDLVRLLLSEILKAKGH